MSESKIPEYWFQKIKENLTPTAFTLHSNWPHYPQWMRLALWAYWPLECPEDPSHG